MRFLVPVEQRYQKVFVGSGLKVLGVFYLLVRGGYLFYYISSMPYRGILVILDSRLVYLSHLDSLILFHFDFLILLHMFFELVLVCPLCE